jgi:hypothetical protein
VAGNVTEGVLVARGGATPGRAELYRCTVRDTKKNPASENFARGIEVGKFATAHIEGCTAMGNAEHEILITEGGSATIVDTTTVGSTNTGVPSAPGLVVSYDGGAVATRYAAFRPRAAGIGLEENAVMTLTDSFISEVVVATLPTSTVGPQGIGVSMKSNSVLTMKGGALNKATGVSLLLSTATASLEGVAIVDTLPRFGLGGRGVSVQDGSSFTALNSAIVGSHETGIVTFDPGSRAVLTGTTIEETKKDDFGSFGIALLATTDSTLELNACTVTHSDSIGLAVSSATAAVRGSWLSFNDTGVHAQDGVTISTSKEAALVPNVLSVSEDTRFVSNAQNTGLGTVALPSK